MQGTNGNGEGLLAHVQNPLHVPNPIQTGQGLGSSLGLGLNPIQSGLATVKRNSMSRAEGQAVLEEAFRASTLSRRGGRADAGDGRVPFRREASVPRATAAWSDSLPRKDLFTSNIHENVNAGRIVSLYPPSPVTANCICSDLVANPWCMYVIGTELAQD